MREGTIQVDGAKVKRLREGKGWSQESMVSEIERLSRRDSSVKPVDSKKTIARIENGEPAIVSTVYAVAKALGVEVDDLRFVDPLNRFASFIENRTQGFVGRQFLFKAIEQFQKAKDSGYFVIEGLPGIGKSAIIAQYAKRTNCVVHFNIRSAGIKRPQHFVESMCSQLSARFGLPYASPPQNALGDPGFIARLLQECAQKLRPQERLVIAVDALDEVEGEASSSGGNVLYLPSTLPLGVHFLLTTRRKADLPLVVQADEQVFELKHDSDENLFDIREYIEDALKRKKMQLWMNQRKVSSKEFVSTLSDLSEGNFMYLRYVLPAIEEGDYEGLNLPDIPRGLERYYEDHWRRMGMFSSPIPEMKLKILYILAEAGEPISRTLVADFCGEDEIQVQSVLDDWMEFLQEVFVEGSKRFSLYHASFRDFLRRKDILQAAGVTIPGIHALIAENLWQEVAEDGQDLQES